VSELETLPPDQRAVLQLILVQGRGYADLASTLKLDVAAVRARAHAGAEALALGGGGQPDAATRGRVVDYLLGQQDDGERIVTFAALGDSPAACRWAQALRERLAGVARDELPEVPEVSEAAIASVANGSVPGGVALASPPPAAAAPAPAPPAPPRDAPREPSGPQGPDGPRPSRLGGAILIAGAAALAIVLAIVLIGGGGGDGGKASTSASGGQTGQTSARTQTQAARPAATNGSTTPASARLIGQAILRSPAGSGALGAGLLQQAANGSRVIAVEAARLPGNGAREVYGLWLQGSAGSKFLGFVPRPVRSDGTFTVSSQLPRGLDLTAYSTLLVTTEGTTAVPGTPGATVLSGPLRLTG
jgi:Sigma-70, region 4